METEDTADGQLSVDNPCILTEGLKCAVCWEYLTAPHTIPCGHTFCLSCLQTLASTARVSRTHAPLDRLRFNCPTCRRKTLARPILRQKAAVNYVMKEMVNEWLDSPYATGKFDVITLRSLAVQTTDSCLTADSNESESDDLETVNYDTVHESKLDPALSNIEKVLYRKLVQVAGIRKSKSAKAKRKGVYRSVSRKETPRNATAEDRNGSQDEDSAETSEQGTRQDINDTSADDIAKTDFHQKVYHRMNPTWMKDHHNRITTEPPTRDYTPVLPELPSIDEIVVTTSSEESISEPDIPFAVVGNIRVIEDNNNEIEIADEHDVRQYDVTSVADVLRLFFKECVRICRHIRQRRSRLLLTIFWFLYCGLIVFLFSSCLPWIGLYSVIYFLIIYAELEPTES